MRPIRDHLRPRLTSCCRQGEQKVNMFVNAGTYCPAIRPPQTAVRMQARLTRCDISLTTRTARMQKSERVLPHDVRQTVARQSRPLLYRASKG